MSDALADVAIVIMLAMAAGIAFCMPVAILALLAALLGPSEGTRDE